MDEQRFDALARRLAGSRSRRSFLRGLIGSIMAGAGGTVATRPAMADSEPDSDRDQNQGRGCKRSGKNCKNDGQCCSGLICWDGGVCTPGCRINGAQIPPGQLDPNNACQACAPATSTAAWTPTAAGSACDDGDACTSPDVCNGAAACGGTLLLPGITCPGAQQVPAGAGICGAAVAFSASSDCGTVSCDHASGETFPVGATTVTCTAANAAGATDCSFTVTVTDETAPEISCPAPITQAATSAAGVTVDFSVSATDNCSPVTINCSPASGSSFPVGATQVTCTATDPTGRQDTCDFAVTVNCTPDCTGKLCGADDGCGGHCFGDCADPGICADAFCDDATRSCIMTNLPIGEQCETPCYLGGMCDGAGHCINGVEPDCDEEAGACQTSLGCDPDRGGCVFGQSTVGTPCDEFSTDRCLPSFCTADGACKQQPVECDPECQTCSDGACISIDDQKICGNGTGYCQQGSCESPCGNGCRDWCYEDLDQAGEPTGTFFCCPEPARLASGFCCWIGGRSGIVQNNGTTCTHPRQVCEGGVICDVECCGSSDNGFAGVCPGPNQYCINDSTLLSAGTTCTVDADCVGLGTCAEIEFIFNDEGDPIPVPNSGICCPAGYISGVDIESGPPIFHCCPPGTKPPDFGGGDICCAFPKYESGCINCDCSFKGISRCCS